MEHPPNRWLRSLTTPMRALLLIFAAATGLNFCAAAGEPVIDQTVAARKLYLNRCSKCHKLYVPSKYSDLQWQRWMEKMGRKAKLQPEQQAVVSNYIETELRHPKPAAAEKTLP